MNPQLRLPRLTGLVRKLIIVLFAAYVIELLLKWQGIDLAPLLALTPGSLMVWQLVTYVFVLGHTPPLWLLFGLLILWWVLSPFEVAFGSKRTGQLAFACTLAGGLAAEVIGFAMPGMPPLAGSSTMWFGAIMATTYLYRDRQMSLFGLLNMTGTQFMLGLVGLTVLNFLFSGNLTHFVGDLGAMGGGIAFIRWLRRPRGRQKPDKKKRRSASGDFRVIQGGRSDDDESPPWLN